jgi:gliding motility-associated-like protein
MKTFSFPSCLFFIVVFLSMNAQGFSQEFPDEPCENRHFLTLGTIGQEEWSRDLIQVPEGYIRAGLEGDEAFLELLNNNFSMLWKRNFNFSNGNDFFYDISLDSDGHILGVARNQIPGGTVNTAIKYDYQNDEVVWCRQLENPDITRFEKIIELPSGDVAIAGDFNFMPNPGGASDLAFMVLDGDTGASISQELKNLGSLEVYQDLAIYNNKVYVAGVVRYSTASTMRPCISRYDSEGNYEWTKSYLQPDNISGRLYGRKMLFQSDSILLFSRGSLVSSNLNSASLQLTITNLDGEALFSRDFDISGSQNMFLRDFKAVEDGYLVAANHTYLGSTSILLFKLDKDFSVVWGKDIGTDGEQVPFSMLLTEDHIILDGTHEEVPGGPKQILLVKLSMDGVLENNDDCNWVTPVDILETDLPVWDEVPPLFQYTSDFDFDLVSVTPEITGPFPIKLVCGAPCPEECDNDIDDDLDGLVDCLDPDLAESKCCITSTTEVDLDEMSFFVPNAFSPNDDGLNDSFNVISSQSNFLLNQVSIFDRWGNQVYSIEGVFTQNWQGWDGRISGKDAPSAVYVYMIQLQLEDGTKHWISGDITLVR